MNPESLRPGDHHYRAYVGNPCNYDLIAATTFNLLTCLGLRQHHKLLDVGCGSLRNGRLLIPYLNPKCYYGIEPNGWLVKDGEKNETGKDLLDIKAATFSFTDNDKEMLPHAPFDFILLQSIFSHCGVDLMHNWIQSINSLLSDEGLAVFTWVSGSEDATDNGWIYPGLVKYTNTYLTQAFKHSGLYVKHIDWPHPIQKWAIASKSSAILANISESNLKFNPTFTGK